MYPTGELNPTADVAAAEFSAGMCPIFVHFKSLKVYVFRKLSNGAICKADRSELQQEKEESRKNLLPNASL
jgi:hypothetical protein